MRVFNGGLWTFDNHLLILGQIQVGDIPSQISLFHVNFWVQVHDVPARFMSPIVGQHLGNYIGEFVEYDENNNVGIWKSYTRTKVRVDVCDPLRRRVEWRVVHFKYERLGTFCFICGFLGHGDQYRDKHFTMEEDSGFRG